MANPKRKHSKQRKRTRASHHAFAPLAMATCRQCGQPKTPHAVCSHCGHYDRGREVVKQD